MEFSNVGGLKSENHARLRVKEVPSFALPTTYRKQFLPQSIEIDRKGGRNAFWGSARLGFSRFRLVWYFFGKLVMY